MATVVVLVDGVGPVITLSPTAADELARLGVTSINVLRDGSTTAVVLRGWSFTVDRVGTAMAELLPGARRRSTLESVFEVSIGAA
jgi:hypothetical protein